MQEIIQLLSNPLVWKLLGGYWVYSAATRALPEPKSNPFYIFIYKFAHGLAANFDKTAKKFNVPGAPDDKP